MTREGLRVPDSNSEHVEVFNLGPNGWIPNNPLLPVLIYRDVLPAAGPEEMASAFEKLFGENGWPPEWRNGIYNYHHYHSTAHEALGIAAGSATLELGGPNNLTVQVEAGDAILLPAGTGHRKVEASRDFLVVGAYPPGQQFDICRKGPTPEMLKAIANLKFPSSAPVGGSLKNYWPKR